MPGPGWGPQFTGLEGKNQACWQPGQRGCGGETRGYRQGSCGRRGSKASRGLSSPLSSALPAPAPTPGRRWPWRQQHLEGVGAGEGHPSAGDVESLVNQGGWLGLRHRTSACCSGCLEAWGAGRGAASAKATPVPPHPSPGTSVGGQLPDTTFAPSCKAGHSCV